MSENVLLGCRNSASGKKQRKTLADLERKVCTVMNDPTAREEAGRKEKARTVSETDISEEVRSQSKLSYNTSPLKQ